MVKELKMQKGKVKNDQEQEIQDLLHRLSGPADTVDEAKHSKIKEISTFTKFRNEHEKPKKVPAARKAAKTISKKARELVLARNKLKYSDHIKLNDLWNSYMEAQFPTEDLTNAFDCHHPSYETTSATFSKSDYHGALVEVLRSKNSSLLNTKGILVKETQNIFTILSEDNVCRQIPKKNSVFRFHWKNLHLDVFGNNLCMKSAMRTTRKIKSTSSLVF